ncbi:glycosyltransferase [Kineococcus auxinigenes]|uniref:glycosyltransferase n=1 Tax=unclassified Kineococcus TaxID=2621656 RepID=UPI003D7D22D4
MSGGETPGGKPRIAVYRRAFLNRSETFVRDHMLFLRRHAPTALASWCTPQPLEVPGVPLLVARDTSLVGRVAERLPARLRGYAGDRQAVGLRAALSRLRPDLLHVHFGSDASVVVEVAAELGIPLVVTWHGYDATLYDEALARSVAGRLLLARRAQILETSAATIAVSGFIADELARKGADRTSLHVVPCGVDVERLVHTPPPVDGGLLFVGRLVQKKGLEDLLRALAGVPGAPALRVIGDGPLRAGLEELASQLQVDVRFLGTRSTPEVAAAMRESVAVVIPSRRAANGDCEGLPVTSLEAAASGRPVIAYAHSGLRESVVDGETGLLVPEGDVEGLSAAISTLLADRDMQQQFGRAGRRHVEERFDIRATTERIERIYDEALTVVR